MYIAEHKLSLFRQIDQLQEESLLELEILISQLQSNKKPVSKRQLGCMKGLVVLLADDFDAPLDDFKEYMYEIFTGYSRFILRFCLSKPLMF